MKMATALSLFLL